MWEMMCFLCASTVSQAAVGLSCRVCTAHMRWEQEQMVKMSLSGVDEQQRICSVLDAEGTGMM